MLTEVHSLVPCRGLFVDFFFHIFANLSGYRNESKVCLWVKAQRFQERGDLSADLVISTINQLEYMQSKSILPALIPLYSRVIHLVHHHNELVYSVILD